MGCTSWVAGVPLLLRFCNFIAILVSELWKFTFGNSHSILPFHGDFAVSLGANITACFLDEAKTV